MFKNIVAILFLLPVTISRSSAQKMNGQFTINGKIKGQEEGYIYLNYVGSDEKFVKDSCAINDHWPVWGSGGRINQEIKRNFFKIVNKIFISN